MLYEYDAVAFDIDLHLTLVGDAVALPKLGRQHDAAQLVDAADMARRFQHIPLLDLPTQA